jgi:tRNA threonylcarbamoyladenosine biosynthesis protein TsaB
MPRSIGGRGGSYTAGVVAAPPLLLALDTGSPLVSVALGRGDRVLASRAVESARSSERLLALIDEVLREAGATLADLGGLVALRGPGSFTGLRIGLATAFGLHQARALPAAALPTLRVLAAAADGAETAVGAVDALRGEWFVQSFDPGPAPRPRGEPHRLPAAGLPTLAPCTLVGFGAVAVAATLEDGRARIAAREPGPLAPVALGLAHHDPPAWDATLLTRPLYLRAPATTPPAPGRGAAAGRR